MAKLIENIKKINNFISNPNSMNQNIVYYQQNEFVEHQENLISNLNQINNEIETKSNEIINNIQQVKKNLNKEDFNETLNNVNKLFSVIDSLKLIESLKRLKNDIAYLTMNQKDIKESIKNISDGIEELVVSMKKAEENDLFLLINLVK